MDDEEECQPKKKTKFCYVCSKDIAYKNYARHERIHKKDKITIIR